MIFFSIAPSTFNILYVSVTLYVFLSPPWNVSSMRAGILSLWFPAVFLEYGAVRGTYEIGVCAVEELNGISY